MRIAVDLHDVQRQIGEVCGGLSVIEDVWLVRMQHLPKHDQQLPAVQVASVRLVHRPEIDGVHDLDERGVEPLLFTIRGVRLVQ